MAAVVKVRLKVEERSDEVGEGAGVELGPGDELLARPWVQDKDVGPLPAPGATIVGVERQETLGFVTLLVLL